MPQTVPIADLHLDLAWIGKDRDLTKPAAEQVDDEAEPVAVSLPELEAGGVNIVGATLFALPQLPGRHGYTDQASAARECRRQLDYYRRLADRGHVSVVREAMDLKLDGLKFVVLMEGADAIAFPEESEKNTPAAWHEAGVRIVGLAWRRTRWTGGTTSPGGLTDDGRRLVPMLDEVSMIHDASHLAEEAVDDLLDLTEGPICASHSNCRIVVGEDPTGRHLPDRQIKQIASRGGVIGINLYDKFLISADKLRRRRTTLDDWLAHVQHACDLIGDATHVGLGSDADGGFGAKHLPQEIKTMADLPKLADGLAKVGFSDEDVRAILGGNWRDYLTNALSLHTQVHS